jgi:protocatechuate 3,4-dioxygenase beta subunit
MESTMSFIRYCLMLAIVPAVEAQMHEAPPNAPARVMVAAESEPGTRITVSGRVIGVDNKPLAGASIYVYQTDARGEYIPGGTGAAGSDRPRLFGYLRSDAQGGYSFNTIRPGSYPNSRNPGHIHFEVVASGHAPRIYEIVFEGDALIPEAFREQARSPHGGVAIVTARTATNRALEVTHDIRMQAR